MYDGIAIPRQTKESLMKRKDYAPWMDILTAQSIMSYGPVPYDSLAHAGKYAVQSGLQLLFGDVKHWWRKLLALFPPTGQVKNFLNAALVAYQIPSGGKMAILGSRYSQGSGDWIELLAHWLSRKGKTLEIHCYDPNEAPRLLVIGTVRVVAIAQSVARNKLRGYDGWVDDVYVSGVGYDFTTQGDVKYCSYKMYEPGEVHGVYYPLFLHETEARYFSFEQSWVNTPSICSCQRCKIEAYLDISVYSDICGRSPCRELIPEAISLNVMWVDQTLGQVAKILTPVEERARAVLATIRQINEEEKALVNTIAGYSPHEVPFASAKSCSWPNESPVVVQRPGSVVDSAAVRISRSPVVGWRPDTALKMWTSYARPTTRRYVRPGKVNIICQGLEVERMISYSERSGGIQVDYSGTRQVKQWCFQHRLEDSCGFATHFLDYPLCHCGHRHGEWDMSRWGNVCGKVPIETYEDYQAFLNPKVSAQAVIPLSDIVMQVQGDPIRIANHPQIGNYGMWSEQLRSPDYYWVGERFWYYPWENIRRVALGRLSKSDFVSRMVGVTDSPWPDIVFSDPASPVRLLYDGSVLVT